MNIEDKVCTCAENYENYNEKNFYGSYAVVVIAIAIICGLIAFLFDLKNIDATAILSMFSTFLAFILANSISRSVILKIAFICIALMSGKLIGINLFEYLKNTCDINLSILHGVLCYLHHVIYGFGTLLIIFIYKKLKEKNEITARRVQYLISYAIMFAISIAWIFFNVQLIPNDITVVTASGVTYFLTNLSRYLT